MLVGASGGSSEGDRRSWYLWAVWLAGLSCSLQRFVPLLTPWVLRELPFLGPSSRKHPGPGSVFVCRQGGLCQPWLGTLVLCSHKLS